MTPQIFRFQKFYFGASSSRVLFEQCFYVCMYIFLYFTNYYNNNDNASSVHTKETFILSQKNNNNKLFS